MASRLLERLKRSLFKEGEGAEPQPPGSEQEADGREEERWEAELAEEEECVSERLGGMLCFDGAGAGAGAGGGGGGEEGGEEEGSGIDSDSDFLSESMEEGLSSTETSPVGGAWLGPSPAARLLQEGWRGLRGGVAPAPPNRERGADQLLFEATDASVVVEGSAKYVLYTIHVVQAGGSDKTPAVITRRYSDFQRLHATLRRNHGDQMHGVCFPRKKLRSNYTAQTIARRSRAFEQYLSHLCSGAVLRGASCVRLFFYLPDLLTGQLLIRVGRYQEALGPLLNAKRLQTKLGHPQAPPTTSATPTSLAPPTLSSMPTTLAPPPASPHWLFTLVALASCFQEVDQLEEAQEHCDEALRLLAPPPHTNNTFEDRPHPQEDGPHPLGDGPYTAPPIELPQTMDNLSPTNENPPLLLPKPHPLLLQLLRAIVRLSWQTGRDKRQWEGLLQQLEEQWVEPDNQPTIKEFLVKQDLRETETEG
ncbi:unnamed protein product [Boreogadus saida]